MNKTIRRGRISGTITPPCSKSYAQRALAAALLSDEVSVLRNIGYCDDTRSAMRCIEALGAKVTRTGDSILTVEGGLHPAGDVLQTGESGLSTRLFTPIAALCSKRIAVRGEGTLLQRPMGMMGAPLRQLGVRFEDRDGKLPLTVCGPMRGGEAEVDASISSQFLTGLLLALPRAASDSSLHVRGAVSTPYIDMTIDTAERFGVEIFQRDYTEFFIPGRQRYRGTYFGIEGDWSAAAMLLVAGATAGEATVRNIPMLSKQADTAICTALVRAGAAVIHEGDCVTAARRPLRAFEFDATHCPDLFPALTALAAAAEGVSVLRGAARLMHKESDRAASIREEYAKLGIEVELPETDVMTVRGGTVRSARVNSRNDHRIAMSLAVAALRADRDVTIEHAECVAKSYPGFFGELEKLRTDV